MTTPRGNDSLRGLPGLKGIVMFTVMIYFNKRTQKHNQQREKKHVRQSLGEARLKLPRVLCYGSHRKHGNPAVASPDNRQGVLYTGECIRDSVTTAPEGTFRQKHTKNLGFLHLPHCLFERCGHSRSLFRFLEMVEILLLGHWESHDTMFAEKNMSRLSQRPPKTHVCRP